MAGKHEKENPFCLSIESESRRDVHKMMHESGAQHTATRHRPATWSWINGNEISRDRLGREGSVQSDKSGYTTVHR